MLPTQHQGDSLFYTSDYIILIIIQIGWHVGGWQQLCTGSSCGLWTSDTCYPMSSIGRDPILWRIYAWTAVSSSVPPSVIQASSVDSWQRLLEWVCINEKLECRPTVLLGGFCLERYTSVCCCHVLAEASLVLPEALHLYLMSSHQCENISLLLQISFSII